MNDLEHDLRELFEQRASGVDVPGLAPGAVLHRGRRRQIGTVLTGVLACFVALGVAVAAIGTARQPAVIPGGGNGLPERTTSIGGVPVTAPAGWTLVDDWPMAAILATTSKTCTFSSTGTAVSASGSPVAGAATPASEGSSDVSGSTSGQGCSTDRVSRPAGVPVLQLANFEIPLMETVCGLSDTEAPARVPADGVAVYVGMFPTGSGTAPPTCAPAEGGSTAFMRTAGIADTAMTAFLVAGQDASSTDRAFAEDYIRSLDGTSVTPTAPASVMGPGYVVASGRGGGTDWRLEAGITSFDQHDGTPTVGAVMVTTSSSDEGSRTVDLPTDRPVNDDYVDLGEAGVVQFGTARSAVTGIDVGSSSDTAPATLLPWPDGIRTLDGVTGALDGWLWFAVAPTRGEVHPTLSSDPTTTPNPDQSSGSEQPQGQPLQTMVDGYGKYVVFGSDFGHEWSFTQEPDGSLLFSLDGAAPSQGYTLMSGGGTQIDIDGGTLKLMLEPPSVNSIVATSVDGNDVVAAGRYAPPADYAASSDNIWVLALPGSGTATFRISGETLPHEFSWPTDATPAQGQIFAGGSTPDISWHEWFVQNDCLMLVVDFSTADGDTGSTGSTACPVPWSRTAYPSSVSYIGGVYGQHHATILMTGPSGMLADVRADGDPTASGNCGGSVSTESPWSSTGQCVFVIPVGESWTIQPTQMNGTSFGQPITITASPGSIEMSGPGAPASPTP